MNPIQTEPYAEGPYSAYRNDDAICQIRESQIINFHEISQTFSLSEEETKIIQDGVNAYCSNNIIKRLAISALDYPKSIFINTPWKNAVTVLESKIEGEKRKEVAVFLLTFCLEIQKLLNQQLLYSHFLKNNLSLTIEKCLEDNNCRIIGQLEKNWNIGKNPNSNIEFEEEV